MRFNFVYLVALFLAFSFTVDAQEIFRTQTIGGWGSNPNGNNPGAYLHDNFDLAFPEGLMIGSGDMTVLITSADAITSLLPMGGQASSLSESLIDPHKSELKNVLAAQLIAATLSVTFDAYSADFSSSEYSLATMVIAEGDMAGMTVQEVIDMANMALAGMEVDYSLSIINETLSGINEAYVDGEIRSSYLMVTERTQLASKSSTLEAVEAEKFGFDQ